MNILQTKVLPVRAFPQERAFTPPLCAHSVPAVVVVIVVVGVVVVVVVVVVVDVVVVVVVVVVDGFGSDMRNRSTLKHSHPQYQALFGIHICHPNVS